LQAYFGPGVGSSGESRLNYDTVKSGSFVRKYLIY
jgi:hypothetical protein